MNTGYLIYQAERTRSAAEQQEIDRSNAQLAVLIGRMWRAHVWRRIAGGA